MNSDRPGKIYERSCKLSVFFWRCRKISQNSSHFFHQSVFLTMFLEVSLIQWCLQTFTHHQSILALLITLIELSFRRHMTRRVEEAYNCHQSIPCFPQLSTEPLLDFHDGQKSFCLFSLLRGQFDQMSQKVCDKRLYKIQEFVHWDPYISSSKKYARLFARLPLPRSFWIAVSGPKIIRQIGSSWLLLLHWSWALEFCLEWLGIVVGYAYHWVRHVRPTGWLLNLPRFGDLWCQDYISGRKQHFASPFQCCA